jgi:hypothetical protein
LAGVVIAAAVSSFTSCSVISTVGRVSTTRAVLADDGDWWTGA